MGRISLVDMELRIVVTQKRARWSVAAFSATHSWVDPVRSFGPTGSGS